MENVFIVYMGSYIGSNISGENILEVLNKECPQNCEIKYRETSGIIFCKIVKEIEYLTADPNWLTNSTLMVSGYRDEEVKEISKLYNITSTEDKTVSNSVILGACYSNFDKKMFNELKDNLHFCSVIWNGVSDTLLAGVTTPIDKRTHLYCGYNNRYEIMFSNDKKILSRFCSNIFEVKNNTYMMCYKEDGILCSDIYNFDDEYYDRFEEGEKMNRKTEKNNGSTLNHEFISRENADDFLSILNAVISQITDDTVRHKIESNIDDYLSSKDSKKKIEDYILKELDSGTKRNVLGIIKSSIKELNIENKVIESISKLYDEKLAEYSKKVNIPVVNVIKLKDIELGRTKGEFFHEKFEEILSLINLDEPVMLIGPAGAGKNHCISQVSRALGKKMYYTNNASNEFKLTGFIDAGGNYRETEFYKAFKNGGIFFLDEIDASDPTALIVANSALANGYMAFPHETIERHKDFRMVAAANTWGRGSDLEYVGRNALDGSTLDRYDNVFYDYDWKLESALFPNKNVLEFMWSLRAAVENNKIHHIVSTRGIGKVYRKEINGIPIEIILRTNVIKNLGQDEINTIIGSMKNINQKNKYYKELKTLKLDKKREIPHYSDPNELPF